MMASSLPPTTIAPASPRPPAESLYLPGPAGRLQTRVDWPPGFSVQDAHPKAVAIVCHPHPLYGGNMGNKVAFTLARAFNDLGMPAVRFNFRGVGESEGAHDRGVGEVEDCLAVIDWARTRWPAAQIYLGGFSFGAYIALCVAQRQPLAHLVTVAMPVAYLAGDEQPNVPCPWLFILADADEIIPIDQALAWLDRLANPPQLLRFPGAGHFFHGQITALRLGVFDHLCPTISTEVSKI